MSEEDRIEKMSDRQLKKTLNNIHNFLVRNYPIPFSVKHPLLLWWMKLGEELQDRKKQEQELVPIWPRSARL